MMTTTASAGDVAGRDLAAGTGYRLQRPGRSGVRRTAVLALVVLLLAGCNARWRAGAGAATAKPTATAGQDIPTGQRSALADGKVTLAEYQTAFASFASCVSNGGGQLEETSRDASGLIHYGTPVRLGSPDAPDLTSVEGRCYHDTFDRIEFVFQTTDPAVLAAAAAEARRRYAEQIRPCLIKNGKSAPETVDPGTATFNRLFDEWAKFDQRGKC
jgi:hypothetical protein